MCLGLLLNVIAIKIVIENKKHKYLKVFVCLLIATICYQGLLNMFPVFAMLIYIVKQIVDKREYKIKEKEFFLEMIKLAFIVILVLAISMSIVNISKKILNSNQDRNMHLINFEAVLLRGETVLEYMDELWNNQMYMLPKHTYNMVLIITFIMLIALKTQKEIVMQFILLLVIAFTICTVPMFIFNTGICARVNNPLMMIWGVSLIILLTQSKISNKYINIIYVLILISFLVNSIFIMQNITEHIASNRVEENMGRTIKKVIEDYEENTGIKVTKFGYLYDLNPQQYAVGLKPMQSMTERKLASSWSIRYAMNFYCERKFEHVGISIKTFEEKYQRKILKNFLKSRLFLIMIQCI